MTIETRPADDEPFPWEALERTATVNSRLHVLTPTIVIDYSRETYPSVTIQSAQYANDGFTLSVTGDEDQRREVAAKLREAADFIESWLPAVPE